MDYNKLANLLFPNIKTTVDDLEKRYPPRNLKEGAIVTRFAPSPTGIDLHLGHLFNCLIASTLAKKSNGVYFLRIEDTDKKREKPGSVQAILKTLKHYGIVFTEGRTYDDKDNGNYGPYLQSERVEIYQTVAKKLVSEGKAYPCFCTEEDIEEIRKKETDLGLNNIGYYGEFAKCRNLSYEEIEKNIKDGKPFVIRLKCPAKVGDRFKYTDIIKGEIELDANINDVVILKSDGIPPYNFAHVCDDHFMRTTLVIRGEEYCGTPVSEHMQIFEACGFKPPKYAHNPHIEKLDNGNRRKLSKSKDPEASVSYYTKDGYPVQAVLEYLLNLANSDFEGWRKSNPDKDMLDFNFSLKKMSSSGSLFDFDKLNDVSKNYISKLNSKQVLDFLLEWSKEFDKDFYDILNKDLSYSQKVFAIDRDTTKPRKDIAKWSDVPTLYSYMFNELFKKEYDFDFEKIDKKTSIDVLSKYKEIIKDSTNKDIWFSNMKSICSGLGFCEDMKLYKQDPTKFKGSVADLSTIIRVAITGRRNSIDLFEIINLLGFDECTTRINFAIDFLSNK